MVLLADSWYQIEYCHQEKESSWCLFIYFFDVFKKEILLTDFFIPNL